GAEYHEGPGVARERQREDGARDGGETAVAPGEGNPQQHRGRPVQEERAQMQPGGHALSLLEKTHRRPPRLRKGVALQTGPDREDPPPHPGTPLERGAWAGARGSPAR